MTESVLDLMKYVLLGLLYVFFARVLWAVWSEVRTPKVADTAPAVSGPPAASTQNAAPSKPTASGSASTRAATAAMARSGASPTSPTGAGAGGSAATVLVVTQPEPLAGRTLAIRDEPTFGRHGDCTVSMADDSFLSGRHGRVFLLDDQPMVEDLDSTNGSFHNGTRFGGIRLIGPGDTLSFGSITVEVR